MESTKCLGIQLPWTQSCARSPARVAEFKRFRNSSRARCRLRPRGDPSAAFQQLSLTSYEGLLETTVDIVMPGVHHNLFDGTIARISLKVTLKFWDNTVRLTSYPKEDSSSATSRTSRSAPPIPRSGWMRTTCFDFLPIPSPGSTRMCLASLAGMK